MRAKSLDVIIDQSDQHLVSLRICQSSSELTQETPQLVAILLLNIWIVHLCQLDESTDHGLLLLFLKPSGNRFVIKPDSFDPDLTELVRSEVLSAVLLESKFVEGCLIVSIEFLEEDLLIVDIDCVRIG